MSARCSVRPETTAGVGRCGSVPPSRTGRPGSLRWTWVCLTAALLLSNAAPVQAETPIPKFKGDSVTVAGVADDYRSVRDAIEELEKTSSQRFFVAIVQDSGPNVSAHEAYCRDLLSRWTKQGDSYAKQIAGPRNIVVVASLKTRKISLYPAEALRSRLGMTGPVINQELIAAHFTPKAKAGDFKGGLIQLVRATDKWVVQHEAALAQREAGDRAREAALKADFAGAAAQARTRLDAADASWKAQKGRGVQSAKIEGDLRDARAALLSAEQLVAADTRRGVAELHRAEDLVTSAGEGLQQIGAAQTKLLTELPAMESRLQAVKGELYQQKEAGLPTAALERNFASISESAAAARKLSTEQPVAAAAQLVQVQAQLETASRELENLPQKASRLTAVQAQAAGQLKALEAYAAQVAGRGGAASQLAKATTFRIQAAAQEAQAAAGIDLDASIQKYSTLATQIAAGRTQLAAVEADSIYWGQTFPLTVALLVAGVAALFGVGAFLRSRWARSTAEAAFAKYKDSIVAFSAKLDELRDRHQNLPASDPDFKEPITGETLQVYNSVQTELSGLREKWLGLMERWDKAQALIQSGGRFNVAKYKEAAEAVSLDVHLKPELDALQTKCAEPLDDLEQAHERTTAALAAWKARQDAVQQQIDALAAAGVSVQQFTAGMAAERSKAAAWDKAMVADPLGVRRQLAGEEASWSALEAAVKQTHEAWKRWTAASAEKERLAGLLAEDQTRGLRYPDPQGRPQQSMDDAGRLLAQAWESLDHARASELGPQLEKIEKRLAAAAELREKILKLRESLPGELASARDAGAKVVETIHRAETAFEELKERHDPSTWESVKEFVRQAWKSAKEFDAAAAEIAAEITPEAQQYLSASRKLDALKARQVEARGLAEAVSRLHAELTAMARESREKLSSLAAKKQELSGWFKSNRRDVQRAAVKRFEDAAAALDEAQGLASGNRPNWVRASARIRFADEAFADARKAGEKDVQNATEVRRLRTRLEEERNRIKRFLESNIHDRPSANSRFQSAVQRLTKACKDVDAAGDGPADWDRLREQLTQIEASFKEAEAMAQEDVRLAVEAERAVERASGAFHRTEGFYRSGVKADSLTASRLLNAAREAVRQQRYEEAIQHAASAESAAEEARRDAERSALRYEQEQADLRRRQSGSADLTTIVVGNIIGQVAGHMINQAAFGDDRRHHQSFGGHSPNNDSWGGSSSSSSDSSSGGGWDSSGGSFDSGSSSGGSDSTFSNDGGTGSW